MTKFVVSLLQAYEGCDASMFEINPVLKTSDNKIIAVDAKVTLDGNSDCSVNQNMRCVM
jgi:succinyl-CoA synthetase beta subunit